MVYGMLSHEKIVFVGGDMRSRAMACRLAELGASVVTWALGSFEMQEGVLAVCTWQEALRDSRAVILPMPAFDEQMSLSCPLGLSNELPLAGDLFAYIGKKTPVFGGRLTHDAYALAEKYGVRLQDYSESEEVQIRNAIPTAEGAICLAMQSLDITLHGARVAVLGYGRIGSALIERLRALGARVTVGVRKRRDVARVESACCTPLVFSEDSIRCLCDPEKPYDVIFNTVPFRLFPDEVMACMPRRTVLLELASAPGGWNPCVQTECRTVYAPGLPAKCAPRTAGILLADALIPQLQEVMRV